MINFFRGVFTQAIGLEISPFPYQISLATPNWHSFGALRWNGESLGKYFYYEGQGGQQRQRTGLRTKKLNQSEKSLTRNSCLPFEKVQCVGRKPREELAVILKSISSNVARGWKGTSEARVL